MSRLPTFPDWSFADFTMATRSVLEFLHARLGFQMWMVTRTDGVDAVVLQSYDLGYGMGSGDEFRWGDTYCARMVAGHAPRFAPAIRDVPAYADAPITQQMEIGAYMGVPLTRDDGTLFGTLCALDPDTQREELARELPTLELAARLLSTVLSAELKAADAQRRAERAEDATTIDTMTNLVNRKGWDRSIGREEERGRREPERSRRGLQFQLRGRSRDGSGVDHQRASHGADSCSRLRAVPARVAPREPYTPLQTIDAAGGETGSPPCRGRHCR